jgi:hypothetical protein
MKYKKIIMFIVILLLMNSVPIFIQAQVSNNDKDVILLTDINKTQHQPQFNGSVQIQYNNPDLYNDMVKLSYHIYDGANNILVYENERIPFSLTDGKVQIPLSFKLDELYDINKYKKLIIRFDIVDEKNIYWYNDNTNIKFQTIEISYEESFLGKISEIYGKMFSDQIVQFSISISFIVVLLYFYKRYRKNN